MRLSKFTDYSLRVCLYLGAHGGRRVSIAEIARAHGLSQSNLMKVVTQLVDGGFVKSTRGRSGGIELASPPRAITVGAIARYMEGDSAMVDCATCILHGKCGLVPALKRAKMAFYGYLEQISLADALAANPATLGILQDAAADGTAPPLDAT
ncbi:RrF2 family transcriptional regulator [Primorskyibacter sp. 2E107]|uniref:RrF2 family transcriptional regulator n=1 Tax=Primorskyibacter sp. 2E107 TaxID=3403458 RepID=UPI003AF46723